MGLAGAGLFSAAAAAESRTQSGPASDYPAGFRAPFGSLESASDPAVGSPLVAQAGQPSKAAESAAGEDGSGQAESAGALSPEELTTGPVLEWTEIDPGFADVFSEDGIVVDLWGYRVLDAHGLLAERGLVPDGETVLGWRPGVEDTLVFPLEGRGPVCDPDGDPSTADSVPGELVFTPEELGFTDEEWTGLCPDVAPMRLLWSDGSTEPLADGPEDPYVDIFAFDMLVVDNGFEVSAVATS